MKAVQPPLYVIVENSTAPNAVGLVARQLDKPYHWTRIFLAKPQAEAVAKALNDAWGSEHWRIEPANPEDPLNAVT